MSSLLLDRVYEHVMDETNTFGVLSKLQWLYDIWATMSILSIEGQISNIKCKNAQEFHEMINEMLTLCKQLKEARGDMTKQLFISQIVCAMLKEFQSKAENYLIGLVVRVSTIS
jgi:gag-polypeptide of LTR copia-type